MRDEYFKTPMGLSGQYRYVRNLGDKGFVIERDPSKGLYACIGAAVQTNGAEQMCTKQEFDRAAREAQAFLTRFTA